MGFQIEAAPAYGVALAAAPGVARVVARNPGPYTYHGTNSWMVQGEDGASVIDPGPDDAAHLAALAAASGKVARILLTHTHADHAAGAAALREITGAQLLGWGAPWDAKVKLDAAIGDGERVGPFTAVHTPGHASDHLCFAHAAGLFSGDHVMGWSTSVVVPPDGDMAAYMASLRRMLTRPETRYFSGHGPVIEAPRRLVRGMLAHRVQREAAVLASVRGAAATVPEIVAALYPGLDAQLVRAAQGSIWAHLIKLEREGRVGREGEVFRAAG